MPRSIRTHVSLRLILLSLGICVILGALFFYITFQARFLIAGPTITLTGELDATQPERVIEITGTAENITVLTLNDRPIFTDDAGQFSETLVLPDGYTIMTLRAKDRYGRETTVTQSFVHQSHI